MADKRIFLAIALSLVILITWNVMVEQPKIEREKAAFEQRQAAERAATTSAPQSSGRPGAPVTGPAEQSPVKEPATRSSNRRQRFGRGQPIACRRDKKKRRASKSTLRASADRFRWPAPG